jgi:hypothetical protein
VLGYADDIVFVFKNIGEAVELTKRFREALKNWNLKIGWKKSGIIPQNNQIIKRVRNAVRDLFSVDLPDT